MKISVVYVYPGERYQDYAARFLSSYNTNQTGVDHDSIVICNGFKPNTETECMFACMRNLRLMEHDNSGWDIGAFQMAARSVPSDLMLFFGASAWIKRPSWLERVIQAQSRHGNCLCGAMGSLGVRPHIRTTGFWLNPAVMNEYPHRVTVPEQRYPFEHGPECLTSWALARGLQVLMVTWIGEYSWPQWDTIPNGFHRGDQSALLFGDRISDPPFHPVP